MENTDVNTCEKFHWSRNNRAFGGGKSHSNKNLNKNNNNVCSHWGPVSGSKNAKLETYLLLADYRVYVAKREVINSEFAGDVNGGVDDDRSLVGVVNLV